MQSMQSRYSELVTSDDDHICENRKTYDNFKRKIGIGDETSSSDSVIESED